MPLMQLSTLVLPAPFGPISANSSPRATRSDTRSSTCRPPKRNDNASTLSSAIPSPGAAILLDSAIAAAFRAAGLAEIELLDVAVLAQPRAVAVEHDAAVLQHVAVVRDRERGGGALLHDHDGDAELVPDLHDARIQVFDHDRREPEREFVDQQQLRGAHQRARDRQHLPLSAGK